MLAENDVIEDAANTEDVTDGLRLGRHILNIDNLWSHIAWRATSHKEIVRVISNRGKSKVDDDRLFA